MSFGLLTNTAEQVISSKKLLNMRPLIACAAVADYIEMFLPG
jgi:hypothetical protein